MKRVVAAFPIVISLIFAQTSTTPAQPGQGAAPQIKEIPEVIAVRVAGRPAGAAANLKDKIYVDIANLDRWADKPANPESIILFLDDRPLKQVTARAAGHPDPVVTTLSFDLIPNLDDPAEEQNWRRALVSARRASNHSIPVSVGLAGKEQLETKATLPLIVQRWYAFPVYIALALFTVGVIIAARKSDLLRDSTPEPPPGERRPYSLARTQMAIWFLLVLVAWSYVSLMTQSAEPLSAQILMLIGISGATGIASAAIDGSKWGSTNEKRAAARLELDALVNRLDGSREYPGLRKQVEDGRAAAAARSQVVSGGGAAVAVLAAAAAPTNLAELETELKTKEDRLAAIWAEMAQPQPAVPESHGWIRDILSDTSGMSFHRLQIFAWTVTLGVYFLWTALRDMLLPALDDQLLILMGISSGTYLGLKLPEKID